MDRHDHRPAPLGGGHHARLELATGASRAVRRERDGAPGLQLPHGAEQGPRRPPRAGAADRPVAEDPREVGEVLPVPVLAHHDDDTLTAGGATGAAAAPRARAGTRWAGRPRRAAASAPRAACSCARSPARSRNGRGATARAADGGILTFTRPAAPPRAPPPAWWRPAHPAAAAPGRSPPAGRECGDRPDPAAAGARRPADSASARSWSSSGTTSDPATRFTRLTHSTVRTRWASW